MSTTLDKNRSLSSGVRDAASIAAKAGSMKWAPRDKDKGTYCCDLMYAAAGTADGRREETQILGRNMIISDVPANTRSGYRVARYQVP